MNIFDVLKLNQESSIYVKEIQEILDQILTFVNYEYWGLFDKIGLFLFFFLCFYMVQIYGFFFSRKMYDFSPKLKYKSTRNQGVSVIIAAKNEADNIQHYLESVLTQNYPLFEVIVVNDGSWDNTQDILESLELKYKHLKLCRTYDDEHQSHFSGKKLALTIGIKAAKYEHLLFTDADCRPNSVNWISEVSRVIDRDDLLIMLGSYKREKGIINSCIRFETLKIALTYAGFASKKQAYMSVGRNFAYKKSAFFDVKGFSKHTFVPSGDDDLFIQTCVKAKKTVGVLFSPESKTISEPKVTLKQWFRQKRRHVSTAPHYPKKVLAKLTFLELSQVLFYLGCPVILAFINIPYLISYSIFALTLCFVLVRWHLLLKRLDEKISIISIPFYTVLVFLFQGVVSVSNAFNKPKNWMGV